VARGVLTESDDDEFSFRHALLREALTGQMLGRQRRRLHETALDALLAGGEADPALVAHHARAAGRYADMVDAARRGTESYLAIGSAYQALQLAELGLDEVGDDLQLLAGAARAAWLADLLDDATGYAGRWHDLAQAPEDRAAALYLLVRLAWDLDRLDEMNARTEELVRLVDQLPPGEHKARAMAVAAHFSGRARLAMAAGDLGEALAALEEGRRRDQAFQRRGRRIGYHAVLLAGLSLENGDFPVVDEVLTELAAAPEVAPLALA